MNEIQVMVEKINKMQGLDPALNIGRIYDGLVVDKLNGTLPENILKDYFLPYFAGITPITRNTTVLTEWVSIAGSPTGEVDIVDQWGNILFTTPSIFDTSSIDPTRRQGGSLVSIFDQYELHNNNIPAVANNFLVNAMYDKVKDFTVLEENSTTSKRWQDIFIKYGLQKPNDSKIVELDDLSDDLEY